MSKVLIFVQLLILSSMLSALEIVLINKTESPLFEIYAVSTESPDWGYDLIPYDVILPGDYAILDLKIPEDQAVNFRFVDEDGDFYFKYNMDLSQRNKVLISPEDHAVFSKEGIVRFTISNKTGALIKALYISPEDDDGWGDNLLREYLPESDEVILEFQSSGGPSFYDIRIDFTSESIIKKRVFISNMAQIILTLH